MARSSKTIKSEPATIVAMQKIKQLIFNGDLVADSNHLETELAELLGLSRTPVREATLMLQAQGLLQVQPRKGIKIKAISVDDINDFYEVLSEIECLAVKRAAGSKLPATALDSAQQSIKKIDRALKKDDRNAWSVADEEFHNELVRLGGNKQVVAMVTNIHDQLRRLRTVTLKMRPTPERSQKEHSDLCDAIINGDAPLAGKIIRAHRVEAKNMLIELLENTGLKRL